MSTSVLTDLNTLAKGLSHKFVNNLIDMNSVTVLEQNVREIESGLSQIHNQVAVADGGVRTLNREIGDLQHSIESETSIVKQLMAKGKDATDPLVRSHAQNIVTYQGTLASHQTSLTSQQELLNQIKTASTQLETKHTMLVNRVRELKRLEADTKMKQASVKTSEAIGKMINTGVDVSVDDIESKIRQKNDVASAAFEQSVGSLHTEEDPTTASSIDNLLASLAPQEAVTTK